MKEIIINQYKTGQIAINEAYIIIEAYMKAINKFDQKLLDYICNQANPFANEMLLKAYNVAKEYFEPELNIVKIIDLKTNNLLYVG
jgi:3-oxoacyl-[acyl-carrier-protein] synthase III